jgi:hypothetical protein
MQTTTQTMKELSNYDFLIEDNELTKTQNKKRSQENMTAANNNTSFSSSTGYPQISTFGKKHAQQKLDKPIAIDGEQE